MGSRKEYHVLPSQNGWKVQKNNSQRASAIVNTKAEAVAKAHSLSTNTRSEMIVHGKDGKIQYMNSYGHDPFPPRDKR